MYSLRNNDGIASFKSMLKGENNVYAIYRAGSYGPTFGGGHDLHIANNAGSTYTYFGSSYNLPLGYTAGQTNTKSLLGGTYIFTPSEVEVLYLN